MSAAYIGVPRLLSNLSRSRNGDRSPLEIPRQSNGTARVLSRKRKITALILRSHPRTYRQDLIRRRHRVLGREERARQRDIVITRIRAIDQVSQIKDQLLRLLEQGQRPGHVFDVCPCDPGLGGPGGRGAPELDVVEGDGA